jgi:hypothetical protein
LCGSDLCWPVYTRSGARAISRIENTPAGVGAAVIRDANSIRIFGPGEARGELEKRLKHAGFNGQIVGIETVDKMTDRQIAAKVRKRFLA